LVPGSSPGGPTSKANPHQQWWGFCLLSVILSNAYGFTGLVYIQNRAEKIQAS
jgi:hypothetical protein